MTEPARLLQHLPAIYRAQASNEFQVLLEVFESVLFGVAHTEPAGIEARIDAIPTLFSPLGIASDPEQKSPDRFLPWLAAWVAFSPHKLFTPTQLRKIVAGIVPLYGRRGTRGYIEKLLTLCFDEIDADTLVIDEHPRVGLIIGEARVGENTLLAADRPFWFTVSFDALFSESEIDESQEAAFEQRVAAIIDFAKPAHTDYDLNLRYRMDSSRSLPAADALAAPIFTD